MPIRRIDPAIPEPVGEEGVGWEFIVTEAGQIRGGFTGASIFIMNGESKGNLNVRLGDPESEKELAALAAERSGGEISEEHALAALPRIAYAVHEALARMAADEASSGTCETSQALDFEDIEPWHDPVDGPLLVKIICNILKRYCILPKGAACAIALWILHTYVHDAGDCSPILHISSPRERCGKTRLLDVLGSLCFKPFQGASFTSATVYRAIEKWHPTLLIDEADALTEGKEDLRCVLNSGWTKSGARVPRCVPPDNEIKFFSTWAPKAFAGIGDIARTLEDRAIRIQMKRKLSSESVERFRPAKFWDEAAPIRSKCLRWAIDHFDDVADADPDVPGWLDDRASDNWRVLCAIAAVAGDACLKEAMAAMRDLVESRGDSDDDTGFLILRDLQNALEASPHGRVSSELFVETLHGLEDRPWSEYGRLERPISKKQVAKLLKPFGIRPKDIRIGARSMKGYQIEECQDAFIRYNTPILSATPRQPSNDAENSDFQSATRPPSVADEKTRKSAPILDCRGVADRNGVPGDINPKNGVGTEFVEEVF